MSNFFANLGDIWIGVNNILQGKIGAGVSDFGRFAINTTAGLLGVLDVASNAGLDKHNEDFGQTLGFWGVGSGAYLVLPILGPSNLRDGFSRLAVDWQGDPLWYVGNVPTRNELDVVRVVDTVPICSTQANCWKMRRWIAILTCAARISSAVAA